MTSNAVQGPQTPVALRVAAAWTRGTFTTGCYDCSEKREIRPRSEESSGGNDETREKWGMSSSFDSLHKHARLW